MPEFSVIIPSYNHEAYLAEAVYSVLNQTLTNLELIVVDDGSTDSSLHVVEQIKDARLKVYSQENRGAHAAINRGLQQASGKFISILNSDDRYHSHRLETLVQAMVENPEAGIASSYLQIINENGEVLGIKHGYQDLEPWPLEKRRLSFRAGNEPHSVLLTENFLATSSNFMIRKETFEKVGIMRPLRYCHDWDFALRVAHCQEIAVVPEALLDYRLHKNNTIHENQAAMIYEICWILAVHLPANVNEDWFTSAGQGVRTRQLLNSVYTYGMDRVLNIMLVAGLASDEQKALEWLLPDHPARQECMAFINESLAHQNKKFPIHLTPLRILSGLKRKLWQFTAGH